MVFSRRFLGCFLLIFLSGLIQLVHLDPAFAGDLEERVERGRALFHGIGACGCAACHGVQGKGDGIASAQLPVKPRDLSGLLAIDTDKDGVAGTDTDLDNIITHGSKKYGGSHMMVGRADLSAADRQAIVEYLKSLRGSGDTKTACKLKCECVTEVGESQDNQKK